MEVVHSAEDNSLSGLHAFLHVGPFSRELDACFNGFCTGVHREDHIVSEHLCYSLCEATEDTVVECPRRERELLSLCYQGVDNLGVTMSL